MKLAEKVWEAEFGGTYCTPELHCHLCPALLQPTLTIKVLLYNVLSKESTRNTVRTCKRQVLFPCRDRVTERDLQSLYHYKKRLLHHTAGKHLLESPPGSLKCPSLTNHTFSPKSLWQGQSCIKEKINQMHPLPQNQRMGLRKEHLRYYFNHVSIPAKVYKEQASKLISEMTQAKSSLSSVTLEYETSDKNSILRLF